jgi:hypothetical protein
MDIQEQFVASVRDLTKDLITYAAAIVGLSITFLKDVLKGIGDRGTWALKVGWLSYLVSMSCGIWTSMAITGSLQRAAAQSSPQPDFGFNVTLPSGLQLVSFAIATTLLVIYGAIGLHTYRSRHLQTKPRH